MYEALLTLSDSERLLYKDWLMEAFFLRGIEAYIHQAVEEEADVSADWEYRYYPPVRSRVVFEENPRAVLKQLNWLAEDEEMNPLLTYVLTEDFNRDKLKIARGCIIEIPYSMDEGGTQKFIVTEMRGDSIRPLIWICKLAPYREQTDVNPDTAGVEERRTGDTFSENVYLDR